MDEICVLGFFVSVNLVKIWLDSVDMHPFGLTLLKFNQNQCHKNIVPNFDCVCGSDTTELCVFARVTDHFSKFIFPNWYIIIPYPILTVF